MSAETEHERMLREWRASNDPDYPEFIGIGEEAIVHVASMTIVCETCHDVVGDATLRPGDYVGRAPSAWDTMRRKWRDHLNLHHGYALDE